MIGIWNTATAAFVAVVTLALACGSDDDGAMAPGTDDTGIDAPTTGAGGTSDSSGGALDDSTGTEPAGDPSYPRPSPIDEAGDCPGGFFGPITFDGGGWGCLPPCAGDPPMCPDPGSGDAEAQCATNPLSSAEPCMDSTDCTVAGEMCGNIGGGQQGCLLPPSHCILRCDEGQTCPDDMTCGVGPGICQYAP
jgi:hypothetical protein